MLKYIWVKIRLYTCTLLLSYYLNYNYLYICILYSSVNFSNYLSILYIFFSFCKLNFRYLLELFRHTIKLSFKQCTYFLIYSTLLLFNIWISAYHPFTLKRKDLEKRMFCIVGRNKKKCLKHSVKINVLPVLLFLVIHRSRSITMASRTFCRAHVVSLSS